MLDFNDTQKPAPRDLDAERDAIREALLSRLESVLQRCSLQARSAVANS